MTAFDPTTPRNTMGSLRSASPIGARPLLARWTSRALLLLLLFLVGPAEARLGEMPRSWSLAADGLSPTETSTFPAIDAAELLRKEAAATPKSADSPRRFAVPYAASISPARDGEWTILNNGDSLWRYRVEVPGATDLNLGFTQFHLPRGATLHLWSDDKERHYQGPYTAADNKAHGQLWTPVLPGQRVVIELYVPASARVRPILELGRVGAGFRDFLALPSIASPRQGSCNIDVICPEGDDWRDQIRSAAVYQLGGQWTCSGSLLNDVSQSLTPYFLTAAHCGISTSNASSMVVYWNFESPTCGSLSGGSTNDSQSGATLRATRSDVDMALVELDDAPAESFDVFYSGWDRSNTQPGGAVGIHHPNTDEKAISFAYSDLATTESCIGSSTPATHWTVPYWDLGTTEPGSSGSGLWNPGNQRLIGFLSGGTASCSNTSGDDCYGKLAVAWDGSSASSRLRDWLDPSNSAPAGVAGTDPSGFQIIPDSTEVSVCLPANAAFDLDILRAGTFSESVALTVADLPASFSVGFSANPVTPPAQSTLTIGNASAGDHAFRVIGTSPTMVREIPLRMLVASGAPAAPSVLAPANNAQDIGTSPRVEWSGVAQAAQYELEIASDPAFNVIAYAAVTNQTAHTLGSTLAPSTDYYLRVRALNDCGTGAWATTTGFTTALQVCSSPNLQIPDETPAGVSSEMAVQSLLGIDELMVSVDITHTWVGDLGIDLEHVETGTVVRLFWRPDVSSQETYGCSGSDLDVLFDDAAPLAVQSECESDGQAYASGGSYRPQEALSAFQGVPLEGTWRLHVGDHAGADIGTLETWCLIPTTIDTGHRIDVFADPTAGGSVSGGGDYEPGADVVVTATPAEGYVFLGWSENGQEVSTSSSYAFTAAADRSLTANFERLGLLASASSSARAGEIVELTVQVIRESGAPYPYAADLCLAADHSAGGAVAVSAGDLIDPAPGADGVLCGTTDASGRATFELTTTTAGDVEARAEGDILGNSDPLVISFAAAAPDRLQLDSFDESMAACKEAVVDIRLLDVFGNLVSGAEASAVEVLLSLSSAGTPVVVEPGLEQAVSVEGGMTGVMPSRGFATLVLTMEEAGEVDVVASSQNLPNTGESAPVSIVFFAGAVDPGRSEFSTSRDEIFAGQQGATLVVVPKDSCGAMLGEGQDVHFEASFGLLTEPVDLGDGSYSSDFSTLEGECPDEPAELRARVGAVLLDSTLQVSSLCGGLDVGSPVSIEEGTESVEACAAGDIFALLKVVPRNQSGMPMPAGQDVRIVEDPPRLVMGERWEELDPVSGEPVHMLQVGSNRCGEGEGVPVQVEVGGVPLEALALIEFRCPEVEEGGVEFFANPSVVPTGKESVVRLKVTDRCGNPAFQRGLALEVVGEMVPVLSAEALTTTDAYGETDDGTATVEISSEEPGSLGLRVYLEGDSHVSAPDLVTFLSDEQDINVDPGQGCGCAATGGASPAGGAFVLLGLLAVALHPRRRSHGRRGLRPSSLAV